MVSLPAIDSYSKEIVQDLERYSPSFKHYKGLLARSPANFSDEIRLLKHRHWLKCALATFAGLHSAEEVCRYWTQETEKIINKVFEHCQLPAQQLSLLLFGKLGSRELNLSSDIDIVFVRDNTLEDANLQPAVKKFIKLLSENTIFGFAYRVDINLRPGGTHSPLIPSKANFYNFYDEYLEAWHRLSFIRMRPLQNQSKLNQDLLSYCKKRCFPKRLDFSVIEEIKSVRSRIAFQWRKAKEPFDIKLHPGGIRDIELYVHSLQVIYGGRNTKLQESGISSAIRELESNGALKQAEAQFLMEFYWELRTLENLIHIKNDQHTYLFSDQLYGELKPKGFDESYLHKKLSDCEGMISEFFIDPADPSTSTKISTDDFSEISKMAIEDIRNLKSTSIKKQKVERIKEEILDHFILKVQKIAIDEDLAVQTFKDFILAIKSKTSIFHLLIRHKELLNHLAWFFSISPYAGQILCRRPELIDSFALGQVAIDDNDIEALWESLIDYKLLGQLNAVTNLFKKPDQFAYHEQLSQQADFVVLKLLDFLCDSHGVKGLSVLTMGKWSGMELGIRSDLDFVFISEQEPTSVQIKVARRMITLLTSRSNAGRLYDIDMRLKPNENAGPLILQKSALIEFIRSKAEPWQKQAYLRCRLVGKASFFLKDHFSLLNINSEESRQLDEIHRKLLTEPQTDRFDLKLNYGGLVHTEFQIQKIYLQRGRVPDQTSTQALILGLGLDKRIEASLQENYSFLRKLEQVFQICNDSSSTKVSVTSSNLGRVAKMLNTTDIVEKIREVITEQRNLLNHLT